MDNKKPPRPENGRINHCWNCFHTVKMCPIHPDQRGGAPPRKG